MGRVSPTSSFVRLKMRLFESAENGVSLIRCLRVIMPQDKKGGSNMSIAFLRESDEQLC
jgi:hypothetical protein